MARREGSWSSRNLNRCGGGAGVAPFKRLNWRSHAGNATRAARVLKHKTTYCITIARVSTYLVLEGSSTVTFCVFIARMKRSHRLVFMEH